MSDEGFRPIFSISTDNFAVGKQVAYLANKIFKGVPAGSIPVVSVENYFKINYEAAQQFGIKILEVLLKQANEIIYKSKI